MSSTTTQDRISDGLKKGRIHLDRIRAKAELLKLDAREKKDEVMRDLESAYEDAKRDFSKFKDAAQGEAEAAGKAARDAWDTFRLRYREATGQDLDD